MFNPEQAAAFDAILESVTNNQGYLFLFIYTAGGCGKTFVILLLLRLGGEDKWYCG